jgi:hypothetical protein
MTPTAVPAVNASADRATATPSRDIVRDIARGGFTGILVGLIGAGIGGRIVMRLAALLVPEAAGASTENGNRIGEITLGGSLGLALLGLTVGALAATIWVTVSPWIPGFGLRRAVLTMPIAVALGATGLIAGDNQDFLVLRHNAAVVALLVALVAVIGFLFAVVDDWLDRRLPLAIGPAGAVCAFVAAIGVAIFLPVVVVSLLTASAVTTVLMGIALVVVGLATVGTWFARLEGRPRSPRLIMAGRTALTLAVVIGFARAVPEVARALGVT